MKVHTRRQYQLFDRLRDEEYDALKADIAKRGVMVPVEVDERGAILDGHNRVEIAKELGLTYKTIARRFKSEQEKREHVIKLNLARRHLDPLRWGIAFKKLLEVKQVRRGQGSRNDKATSPTVGEVAKEVGVPPKTAEKRLALADFFEELSKQDREEIEASKTPTQDVSRRMRREKRERIVKEVSANLNGVAKIEGRFPVIYADPPWQYDFTETDNRAIENHYPTLPVNEICDLKMEGVPVASSFADDCVLFLWSTNPKLCEAFQVISAWGFVYVTNMVWVKDKIGMGYYARQRHELLLIAKRGDLPHPLPEARPDSVIEAPRSRHSYKPDVVYALIERMYPDFPKLELFPTRPRQGWRQWGNQA